MQRYLRRIHQWTNPVKRGRKNKKATAQRATAWATDVTCQRFFTYGDITLRAFFEVSIPTNANTRDTEDPVNDGSGNGSGNDGSGNKPSDTLALFNRKLLVNLRKYEERAATITEPGPLDASA